MVDFKHPTTVKVICERLPYGPHPYQKVKRAVHRLVRKRVLVKQDRGVYGHKHFLHYEPYIETVDKLMIICLRDHGWMTLDQLYEFFRGFKKRYVYNALVKLFEERKVGGKNGKYRLRKPPYQVKKPKHKRHVLLPKPGTLWRTVFDIMAEDGTAYRAKNIVDIIKERHPNYIALSTDVNRALWYLHHEGFIHKVKRGWYIRPQNMLRPHREKTFRRALLDFLCDTYRSMEDIRDKFPEKSHATIYTALRRLQKQNLVFTTEDEDEIMQYIAVDEPEPELSHGR